MVSYSTGSLRSCGVQQVQEMAQQSSLCEHLSLMLSSSNIALESFKNRHPTNMLPLSERCLALMESLPAPMKRMMKMLMALVMRILLPRQAGALMTQLADARVSAFYQPQRWGSNCVVVKWPADRHPCRRGP